MINPNRDDLTMNHDSNADIAMSTWEYHDFIDALLDERLTPEGLMKFKRMYRANSLNLIAVPMVTFPIAWVANRWLAGFVNRGIAQSRFNFFGMSIFWPIVLYYAYTRPIPRKLYTDVLADSGPDGTYIRESLRIKKPGLWQKISSQLYGLKFDFPEMLQHRGTDFPSNFVSTRVL
eukprot:GHVR01025408.1.p1 GENE.GHVR01025408.1~~GHVR01025408.1.p1  ORF type:complete len:176 (-),score=5.75 GHVR01025408.1:1666-2193(-)